MSLKAGTISDYADSMSQEMIQAFLDEWPNVMGNDPPVINDQMRLMFVAIAKGVVNHLKANKTSFKVTVSDGTLSLTGQVTEIEIA